MSTPIIDYETFKDMVGSNPRLKAMLEWRLSLGILTSSEQVGQLFLEDWNQVEKLYVRLANTLKQAPTGEQCPDCLGIWKATSTFGCMNVWHLPNHDVPSAPTEDKNGG